MNQLNIITIRGRLTTDPKQIKLENSEITSFTIANNRDYYSSKEQKRIENTHFFDCKGFGPVAKIANEYLKKGREVLVTGTLKQDKWQDKESGDNRSKVIIEIENFEFIGGSGNKTEQQESEAEQPEQQKKTPFKKKRPF